MYGKPAMTCFKYQVYLYGSEAITYLSAVLWVVNPNSLWWVHMGISLKERQITEEPMKVKIWKKLLIHKHAFSIE